MPNNSPRFRASSLPAFEIRLLQDAPKLGLRAGDEITITPAPVYRDGDWIVVERAGEIHLTRYHRFLRNSRILGRFGH